MGSHEKLLKRFLSKPKDFTYSELKRLLVHFGFAESSKGKTSGSRIAFMHGETGLKIKLHKPHHFGDAIKISALEDIENMLREKGFI